MADNKTRTPAGGNKPKPGPGGQNAKDDSRAQSRPVSGRTPPGRGGTAGGRGGGGRGGGGRGGNTPMPGRRPATPAPSRISPAMLTWGAVGLVVIIIVVLIAVFAAGGGTTNASFTATVPAPASVVHDVTNIPLSVYNTIGINSPSATVSPPTVLKNQPPLTLNGKSPSMLYIGGEYCPYCAAERWPMTAALSRFGTFSNLKITASSHTDVDAATHTFSYYGSTYTSPYIHFVPVEMYSNIPCSSSASNTCYRPLQHLTQQETSIATKYNGSQYNPSATSAGGISFPFVLIDNKALISGASYDPGILAGQTWSQIAGGLSDTGNPATQAIVATANYMTAAICASTGNAPSSVCTSSGVKAAAKALKIG
ncbi:MAG: DUF929 family protein [Acidimicrobiales bacterium]